MEEVLRVQSALEVAGCKVQTHSTTCRSGDCAVDVVQRDDYVATVAGFSMFDSNAVWN